MKYIILVLSILFCSSVAYGVYMKHQLEEANAKVSAQLMEANLEIGRGKTELGNAKAKISELTAAQQTDIKAQNGRVVQYGVAEATLDTKGNGSTSSVPVLNPKVSAKALDLEAGALYQAVSRTDLNLVEAIPFEWQDFRLEIKGVVLPGTNKVESQINYKLHMRIGAQLAEVKLPDGTLTHYITIYEIDDAGKASEMLKLDKYVVTVEDKRAAQFYPWAPHLDIGADVGVSLDKKLTYGGSVGVSLMGYGLTKNDLYWRFIRVGLNLSDRIGVDFTPAQYNIGQHIPLLSNLWVGPIVWFNGNTSVGLLTSVQL